MLVDGTHGAGADRERQKDSELFEEKVFSLQVHYELAAGLVVGMRPAIPRNCFPACDLTYSSHDSSLIFCLHQKARPSLFAMWRQM